MAVIGPRSSNVSSVLLRAWTSYGAYRDQDGVCERASFVIDENGTIAWSYSSPLAVNPGADGILVTLEALPPPLPKNAPLEKNDGKAQNPAHVGGSYHW